MSNESKPPAILPRRQSPDILVVEDDHDIAVSLVEILEGEDYTVAHASDGEAALAFLRAHTLTRLVLLDLMMPRMHGWDFRRLQLADPVIAHIPIVVLSAAKQCCTGPATLRACSYLSKPADLDLFLATVHKCASPP